VYSRPFFMANSFARNERLKSKQDISDLFKEGKFIRKSFLALKFLPAAEAGVNKIAFSVPKRRYPKAVDRNRIKRRMLEAYRLNKSMVTGVEGANLHFILIYNSSREFDFLEIQKTLRQLFAELNNHS
jgi:ribonuclease P protein component